MKASLIEAVFEARLHTGNSVLLLMGSQEGRLLSFRLSHGTHAIVRANGNSGFKMASRHEALTNGSKSGSANLRSSIAEIAFAFFLKLA